MIFVFEKLFEEKLFFECLVLLNLIEIFELILFDSNDYKIYCLVHKLAISIYRDDFEDTEKL